MRFMLNPTVKISIPDKSAGPSINFLAKKIPQFTEEDISCIDELWRESFRSKTDPDRYHFVIAAKNNKIVGFACYGHRPLTIGTYDFYWLGVDPDLQHQGIGRMLMTAVEDQIKSQGGYLMILETSSKDEFTNAREMYRVFGYERQVEIADFYKPGDGLVIYTKRLQ
jgi:ribosomal protein S18 acetylase RimI-like enzyme